MNHSGTKKRNNSTPSTTANYSSITNLALLVIIALWAILNIYVIIKFIVLAFKPAFFLCLVLLIAKMLNIRIFFIENLEKRIFKQ